MYVCAVIVGLSVRFKSISFYNLSRVGGRVGNWNPGAGIDILDIQIVARVGDKIAKKESRVSGFRILAPGS